MEVINNKSQIINWVDETNKYQLLTGQVQSGKTNEIINYCYWSIYEKHKSVLVVFQNIKYDVIQFNSRLENFNKQLNGSLEPLVSHKIEDFDNTSPKVYVALGNYKQIGKCLKIIDVEFNMCLDEADLMIKSANKISAVEKVFFPLKNKASHILGVTATNLAILFHEKSLSSIKILKPPEDYHDYKNLNKVIVPPNPTLARTFTYDQFTNQPSGFMLHIEKHRKDDQLILAQSLYTTYTNIMFIVYNGNGLYVFPHPKRELIIGEHYPNNVTYNFKRTITISHLLQRIKDVNIRRISVISGRMAGRGVSFVSEDFKLHITDQLYLPSYGVHDESMAQQLRILGRYQECDLNLYAKKSVLNKIDRNYETRDKCNDTLSQNGNVNTLNKVPLNTISPKFSRKNVCKHIKFKNQDDNVYFDGVDDIPDDEPVIEVKVETETVAA